MAAHWIFINSPQYRRFIERSRESSLVFWGATAGLLGAAYLAANVTMGMTNPNSEEESSKDQGDLVSKLPMHAQVAARKNREHLKAMLHDVTSGQDKARYRAMLDGKIHGTTHGTSMGPGAAPPLEEQKR